MCIRDSHPAAQMLIKIAKAQQEEVGDGTTTATIMAGAMVNEGVNQVLKGVPVIKIIEGLALGINLALKKLDELTIEVSLADEEILKNVALISGRGNTDIAELVVEAAKLIGQEKLLNSSFKLGQTVRALEGAENKVISGIIRCV